MLADKPNADTDPGIGALFQKTKAETDDLKTQLASAQTALDSATQHYGHLKDVADHGITALTTAQHDVDSAKDAQQAAKDALDDAKLRQHDAQVSAGLETSFDSVNPGLAALKAQTAKIQAQAAAASAMADGLSSHQPSSDVAALLAEAAKAPVANTSGMSLKDQLAAMHG
jgi:chromosome segregation ATPase